MFEGEQVEALAAGGGTEDIWGGCSPAVSALTLTRSARSPGRGSSMPTMAFRDRLLERGGS